MESDENEKPKLVLHSVNQMIGDSQRFEWYPRQVMQGKCNKTVVEHPDSETPKDGCSCGIHALDTPLWLAKQGYVSFVGPNRAHYLWGQVDMWGRIIEGSTGVKAQYAYPVLFAIRWDLKMTYTDNEKGHEVELGCFTIRDILQHQWGVPARVVVTATREPKPGTGVIFSDYPELE